jgi:nucleotide-binding universal stress UspA family protein
MFTKIVVPLDGTTFSEQALPAAIRLANWLNASLLLLRAIEVAEVTARYAEGNTADETLEAEEYLQSISLIISDSTLPCHIAPDRIQTLVEYGQAAEEIAVVAPFAGANLIVMTTHARTGLPRLVKGSIANRVLQLATVPVVLIHPERNEEDQPLRESLALPSPLDIEASQVRLVVTLDGSLEAEVAVEAALYLGNQMNATLYLLRIVMPFVPVEYIEVDLKRGEFASPEVKDQTHKRREAAYKYLDKLQAQLLAKGLNCVKAVQMGNPPDEILHYAQDVEASMLVMATHARGRVGQFLLGSMAEQVLRRSHLPVLMVRTALPVLDKVSPKIEDNKASLLN